MTKPSPNKFAAFGNRFSDMIVDNPIKSLLLSFLIFAAIVPGMRYLVPNFTHTAFFRDTDPMLQRFNAFERQFGNDDSVVVVVHSPSGIFDLESAKLLQDLTKDMWQVPEVIRVESLSNFNWVHALGDDIEVEPLIPDDVPLTEEILAERKAVALGHEQLPDYLVSKDGQTALIYARIKPGIDAPPDAENITTSTYKTLEQYKGQGDHAFYVTGGPAINYAFKESSQRDMQALIPMVLLMAVFFLILSFRTVGGVVLPFVVVIGSVVSAMAMSGWYGIEITTLTATLPQILIAIGIADAVHILTTFYHTRRRGVEKIPAVRHALSKNFVPTVLTSLTTAIGFFSFVTADLKPVAGLGLTAGTGAILAWFVTYLVMGPLLVLTSLKMKKTSDHGGELLSASPFGWNVTAKLVQLKKPILIATSLVVLVAAFLTTNNRVNSDPFQYFRKGYPLRAANDFLREHLGGVAGMELVVDAGEDEGIKEPGFLKNVEAYSDWIASVDGISKTVSIVDVLKQTHRSLNGGKDEFYKLPERKDQIAQELFLYTMSLPQGMGINDRITVKNDALRLTVLSSITDSSTMTRTATEISDKANDFGLNVHVTGKPLLYQSMNGYVVNSFLVSVSAAVTLISLLLIVFFGSFKLGMLAMLPNVIPLIVGGAILHLIGQPLDIGTVLVTSVCLGIAVDDTIHVLANYNRFIGEGCSPEEAIARVVTHTGPALITTTLVLVAAFGTFAFATFMPNLYFGVMTACILTTALIVDLTFLPALLLRKVKRVEPPQASAEPVQVAA